MWPVVEDSSTSRVYSRVGITGIWILWNPPNWVIRSIIVFISWVWTDIQLGIPNRMLWRIIPPIMPVSLFYAADWMVLRETH